MWYMPKVESWLSVCAQTIGLIHIKYVRVLGFNLWAAAASKEF